VNLAPHGKKRLILLLGDKKLRGEPGFTFEGEGVGKTVKGKKLSLSFHPKSGQVNVIEYPGEGIRLHNEAGVIHWNPGCFVPGIAWDHSFNWNPPPSFEEISGDFLYASARRGPLQKIKEVSLEVRYRLDEGAPYFLSETRMVLKADLGVVALRNDEMVFFKGLFDSYVYKDKDNRLVQGALEEKPYLPFGLVHTVPDDLDWVGLLNTEKDFGFFSLRIAYSNSALGPAGGWTHKAGTYFYAPSDGSYVYWVRPLLYTWGDYLTNNQLTFVPKGSVFYEKNAYALETLEGDYGDRLDTLLKKLRNPIRVF
jgi:hypothetical protein